jgi:hypothetical protein
MSEDVDAPLRELANLLDRLAAYPMPPPRPRMSPVEYADRVQMAAFRSGIQAQIDRIKGVEELKLLCYRDDAGRELNADYVRRVMAYLASRPGWTLARAGSLAVAEAVAYLKEPPALPEGKERRVKVNRAGKQPTVTLEDGITYEVSPEGAAVVDILTRKAPETITYRQMRNLDSILQHQRAEKIGRDIIDRLPEPIRRRIKRAPGKGCTWIPVD